jgi:hypothetical protein
MRRTLIAFGAAVLVVLVVAVPTFAGNAGNAGNGNTTTCTSTLAPGTYGKVVVPAGASCIIAEGPITIRGGLFVGDGATFVFGSEETPDVTATITGGVHATNPANLQIHSATIDGGLDSHGGSGPFGGPFTITWNAIEDNTINGGATIEGYTGFWMGFIRNTVNGPVNLNGNVLVDEDGNEYVTNTIHGSLNCADNVPAPHTGDSEGAPNNVTGHKTGQCAGL